MSRVMERLNAHRISTSYEDSITTPGAYPRSLVLDVTNRCTLRCPLCPTGSGKSGRLLGDMDEGLAIAAIDECAEFIETVTFGFSGEPLLYNPLLKMIAHAHQLGVRTKLFTNLSIIPDGGFERLIETGIDHIAISLDGIDETQYGFYRYGGDFSTVLEHIRQLVAANPAHHALIETQMLMTRANEDSLDDYRALSSELGADRVKFKFLNLGLDATQSTAACFLPSNPDYHYYDESGNSAEIRREYQDRASNRKCAELYDGPAIIAWDGSYILCCRDERHTIGLGRFPEISVWNYWNGAEMARLRGKQQCHELALCDKCPASFLDSFEIPQADRASKAPSTRREAPAMTPRTADTDLPTTCDEGIANLPDWEKAQTIYKKGDMLDYGAYRTYQL